MYHFERVNKVLPVRLSVCYAIRPQVHQYLKDFQVDAVRFLFLFLAKRESCLFNDESGLGKQVAVAAVLDTVAQNKKTLILVHNDDEYVTGWQFHLHVLTSLSVTVINDEQDYLKVSHVYIAKWSTLTSVNKSFKENFDIIIVDNRGEMLNNNFCTSLLLKLYERHINIIISSVDVTSDLKLLHNTLRLLGRLQPEYKTFNGFKEKFPLTPPIGRPCQKKDIEEYFHQRERLSDYCKTFRLRRCCHQFENDLPLVDKLSYTHNLFVWCQKNNTLESKNNSVEYILSDAETLVETDSLMEQSNLLSDTFYREIFTVDQFSEDVMPPLLIDTDSDNDGHMNSERKDESITLLRNRRSLNKLKKTPLCKRRRELNILQENVAHDLKRFKNVRSSGRVTRSMMIRTRSRSYNKNLYSNNKNKKPPKQLNKSIHKINRLQAKKKRVRTAKSKKCRVVLHDCASADFTKKQFNAQKLDNISESTQMATTAPLLPAGAAAMPKAISFSDNSSEVIYVPPTIINNGDYVTDDVYVISSSHEDLPQLSTSSMSTKLRPLPMNRTTNKAQNSSRKTISPDLFSTASDSDHLICTQPCTSMTNNINRSTHATGFQINNNTPTKKHDCQHFQETTNQPSQTTLDLGTNLRFTEILENAQQASQHNKSSTTSPSAENNSHEIILKLNKITDYLDKSHKNSNFKNHSTANNSNNQQRTPKKHNTQSTQPARNNSLKKKSPKFKTIQTTKLTKWFTNDSPSPPNNNLETTAPTTMIGQAKRRLLNLSLNKWQYS